MKQLILGMADNSDAGNILEWVTSNPLNRFDQRIVTYPTLQVLKVSDESRPVGYLPIHKVLILESVAMKPGLNESVSAQALRDFVKGAELVASQNGIREIWFADGAGGVAKLAEHHGFKQVPWKVWRQLL